MDKNKNYNILCSDVIGKQSIRIRMGELLEDDINDADIDGYDPIMMAGTEYPATMGKSAICILMKLRAS